MKSWMQGIIVGLVIIGAINWGLVGIFDINLVAVLLGDKSMLATIIYSLIGLAGVVMGIRELLFRPEVKEDTFPSLD